MNAFVLLLTSQARESYITQDVGCVRIFIVVCVEIVRGMGPATVFAAVLPTVFFSWSPDPLLKGSGKENKPGLPEGERNQPV